MEEGKLAGLYRLAILCPTLDGFLQCLEQQAATGPDRPPSRRSRKR
jgi:hypothetical protein